MADSWQIRGAAGFAGGKVMDEPNPEIPWCLRRSFSRGEYQEAAARPAYILAEADALIRNYIESASVSAMRSVLGCF